MTNLFHLIDFCSAGVQLRVNGKDRQTSIIGGLVSLLVMMAVLFLIFYLGLDIVLREKPRLIISEVENTLPTFYNLTSKDFMFGFKIVNSENLKVDYENYIDIKIMNTIGVKNASATANNTEGPFNKTENVYTEFETCNKIKDYDIFNISSTLASYQCVKNLSFYLGGDFSDNKFGTLDFMVKPCRGKASCKSTEDLKLFLDKGLFMIIFYRDNMIDPKKADTPIQITHAPFMIGLSDLLQLDVYFNYKNLEVKSDFGFLFEDLNSTYTYKFENREVAYRSRGQRYFLWGTIYLTKKTTTFERRYLKVQEIAANIGGLFKFLWIAGILFMYPISTKSTNIDLMNEMFHFQPYGNDALERKISNDISNYKNKDPKDEIVVNNYSTNKLNSSEEPNLRNISNQVNKNSENKLKSYKDSSTRIKLNKFRTGNQNKAHLELAKENGENKIDVIPFSKSMKDSSSYPNPNLSNLNYMSSQQNIISEQNNDHNKLKLLNNKDILEGLPIGTSKDEIIRSDIKSHVQKQDMVNNDIYGKEEGANDKSKLFYLIFFIRINIFYIFSKK